MTEKCCKEKKSHLGVVICSSFACIANCAEVGRKGRSKSVDQTHRRGRAWPKAGTWVSRGEGVRALAFTQCRGVGKRKLEHYPWIMTSIFSKNFRSLSKTEIPIHPEMILTLDCACASLSVWISMRIQRFECLVLSG